MKNADLRSYIFFGGLFSFWLYKAFAFWFGKICGVFWKSPIKKKISDNFLYSRQIKNKVIPDFTFWFLSNDFKKNGLYLIN